MIEVLLNKPEFEYDIHSLIKAFFPEQYVGVSAEKKEYDEKIYIRMQVNYGEDTIQITWQEIVHANEDAQANEKPGQEEVKEIPLLECFCTTLSLFSAMVSSTSSSVIHARWSFLYSSYMRFTI